MSSDRLSGIHRWNRTALQVSCTSRQIVGAGLKSQTERRSRRKTLAPLFLKPLLPAVCCTYRIRATKACRLTTCEARGVPRSLTRGGRVACRNLLRRAEQRLPACQIRKTNGARCVVTFAVGVWTPLVSQASWPKSCVLSHTPLVSLLFFWRQTRLRTDLIQDHHQNAAALLEGIAVTSCRCRL